jgi:hypothetical protein
VIFSHVLYQLSYLGTGEPGGSEGGEFYPRDGRKSSASRPGTRWALLQQGADPPPFLFLQLQETVPRPLAPDGHVLADAGVIPQDFQEISGRELPHLPCREQDWQRAEGAGDVEAVDRLGQ